MGVTAPDAASAGGRKLGLSDHCQNDWKHCRAPITMWYGSTALIALYRTACADVTASPLQQSEEIRAATRRVREQINAHSHEAGSSEQVHMARVKVVLTIANVPACPITRQQHPHYQIR